MNRLTPLTSLYNGVEEAKNNNKEEKREEKKQQQTNRSKKKMKIVKKNATGATTVITACWKGRKNGTVTTAVGWGQERGKERKKEGELQHRYGDLVQEHQNITC